MTQDAIVFNLIHSLKILGSEELERPNQNQALRSASLYLKTFHERHPDLRNSASIPGFRNMLHVSYSLYKIIYRSPNIIEPLEGIYYFFSGIRPSEQTPARQLFGRVFGEPDQREEVNLDWTKQCGYFYMISYLMFIRIHQLDQTDKKIIIGENFSRLVRSILDKKSEEQKRELINAFLSSYPGRLDTIKKNIYYKFLCQIFSQKEVDVVLDATNNPLRPDCLEPS